MNFRILGPLEVVDGDGRALELGGRQQRLVLAMLLLHRNEVVSVDRLIDAVWKEQAPANAVKNVRIHVSRLRKALEVASSEGVVQTRANGYVLAVGPGELDVDRFERLVEEGRRALAASEPALAETSLREALALWRGEPLSDFAYESFAQSEITRLAELRLSAVEERLDADLALGRRDEVTAELRGLVAEHPLRERLRGQLMLALYRSGRKPDALRGYDEARRALAEELGLEPSESLQALHRAVLTDDSSLAAPARVAPSHGTGPIARAPLPLLGGRRGALLGVGGALVLAAALAVAVLAITRDRTSAGLVSVGPNSLAQIDPETDRVVAAIPVGARPASVVFGEGALWVANLDDDTVSRIDPSARRVVGTVTTGTAQLGLAVGRRSIWGIGADGVVLRIDPAFNEVVDEIETVKLGALPGGTRMAGALAAEADAVWAISGGNLSTARLFIVGPEKGTPSVATGVGPTALALGFGGIWVTDSFENTVSRIDPAGFVVAATPVGRGASAIAVGEGAVWVVESLENRVVRIEPETGAATATIQVGRFPVAVAVGMGSVWVANRNDGSVSRIDPKTNLVVETISVGTSPAGIAVAAGSVWVTNQAGAGPERVRPGGTLRVSVSRLPETDPALQMDPQLNYATCAKLLNYPDAPAPAGTRLVPDVAAALPTRSADGRTYTFRIRKGFAFSSARRESVTAETFKYSIERSLHPKMGGGAFFVTDILGQDAYQSGKAAHISGVVADGDTLSITLVKPAPDFLARLATTFFCAVPLNTPIDPRGLPAIPSAGPYYIAEEVPERRIVVRRNPNYGGSRPQRLREIRYTTGVAPAQSVADVEAGRSDYLFEIPPERKVDGELTGRYGPASAAARNGRQRYFINPFHGIGFLELNTKRPLFSDPRLRKAVNYAIDRRALARLGHARLSGDLPAIPTDQYLPPTMPGASPAPLFPPSGDPRVARRLAPHARGTAVLYTCNLTYCRRHAQVVKTSLKAIGLDVDIREFGYFEVFEKAGTPGEPYDIFISHWLSDYVDPSSFIDLLRKQQIEPRLTREIESVARLSGDARYRAYRALSVQLARDAAPWVAYTTGTSRDFFSARIGCQVFQPVYGIDLAALCVRT